MITRTYNFHGIPKEAKVLYDHVYDVADTFKAAAAGPHGLLPTVVEVSNNLLDNQKISRILDDFDNWTQHYELASADYAELGLVHQNPAEYDRLRANLIAQRIIYSRYPDIMKDDCLRQEKSRLFEQETQGL